MWFKNIQLFQLLVPFEYSPEELSEKLETRALQPCGRTDPFSVGWVSPFGRGNSVLVHACNGCMLIALAKEEKILPAAVVAEALDQKQVEYEAREGQKMSGKKRAALREEIQFTLLQKAFSHTRTTYAYIDPKLKLLIVDASSRNKAEEFTEYLRKTLGSFQVEAVKTRQEPKVVMTNWLLNQDNPAHISLEDQCEMQGDEQDTGIIKCQKHDLYVEEIKAHLKRGKLVSRIAVQWHSKLSVVIHDDFSFKRVKFLDVLKEQQEDITAETKAAQMDADFALMNGEFAQLFEDFFQLFGGRVVPEKATDTELAFAD